MALSSVLKASYNFSSHMVKKSKLRKYLLVNGSGSNLELCGNHLATSGICCGNRYHLNGHLKASGNQICGPSGTILMVT